MGKRTGSFNFFWRSALLAISLLSTAPAFAQDATWLASPTVAGPVAATFDFNANANWTPTTAPGSVTQTGTATFGASNGTNISFSAGITTLSGFTFTAAASNYAFFNTNTFVQFVGAGIVINGGGATFTNSGTTGAGGLVFLNSSTAGSATITNNANGATAFDGTSAAGSASITNTNGGITQFSSTSMAGSATIANNNGRTSFLDTSTADSAGITNSAGGATQFLFSSNARNATITNNSFGTTEFLFTSIGGHATITNNANGITQFGLSGGTDTATAGNAIITNNAFGTVFFNDTSTAGSATIINSGGNNAVIEFNNNSKAGSARITNNDELTFADNSTAGSAAIANSHGEISFIGSSTAGSATITNNGLIFFENTSTGGTARLINGPNGDIDLSNLSSTGMSAGSIEGAGFITLGSKNLTVGGNNLSTTFSGLIGDGGLFGGTGGSLTKVGTGMLTLSGSNLYTGATIVNGGTLEVDGSIATSSAVTVNSGGALAGLGNVSATTINSGGTLAPGNAANPTGTLAITGNLAFASGALYLVQLSGANASKASVTGTATLNGATVNAIFAPGGSVVKQYTIVTAGSVSGTFNPNLVATNLPPGFSASLSYSATDVFLTLAAAQLGKGGGSNGNQQAVTNAITNFFNAGGALPAGFVNLFALSGAPLANALTQLSGETATGSQQTTFDAMGQFMGLLTDPFMGRGGGLNGSASPLGYAEGEASAYASSSGRKTDAFAMFTKAPPAAYEPRWSVWAAGFGGSQTTDGNAVVGSNTATSRIAGTAVGADYLFSPFTLAGFALGGGGTNFSVANGGTGRSDLFQAGAYLRHTNGPAYISAALAYGWQDITTDRIVTIAGVDHLRAELNANAFSGRAEGGYRFVSPVIGGIGITPYAAAQFVTFDLPAYAEQAIVGGNTFAQAFGARAVTDPRTELGIRTDKSFAMPDGILTLRGRFAWAHDFDPDRSIAATFQALPGASFVVNGAAQASDSALVTLSAEKKWLNGWSAAATFEGEFSNVTRSYAGKAVVRYVW